VHCQGVSMQPTINPYPEAAQRNPLAPYVRDTVLVDMLGARHRRFAKGSVVLVNAADDPRKLILKRLVAVEGDWVVTRKGDYVHVPRGHCWLEGDNEDHSIDSNDFGAVPLGLIVAQATHICWPPWRMQRLPVRESDDPFHRRVRRRPFQVEVDIDEDLREAEKAARAEIERVNRQVEERRRLRRHLSVGAEGRGDGDRLEAVHGPYQDTAQRAHARDAGRLSDDDTRDLDAEVLGADIAEWLDQAESQEQHDDDDEAADDEQAGDGKGPRQDSQGRRRDEAGATTAGDTEDAVFPGSKDTLPQGANGGASTPQTNLEEVFPRPRRGREQIPHNAAQRQPVGELAARVDPDGGTQC